MRAVLTRVSSASVTIEKDQCHRIGHGFTVLVGFSPDDTQKDIEKIADKIIGMRVFDDAQGKMNLSLKQVSGSLLLVPNFTLYANCKKGNRPSFITAAPPEKAEKMYNNFYAYLKTHTDATIKTGSFRTHMDVQSVNDGPVTVLLDTATL